MLQPDCQALLELSYPIFRPKQLAPKLLCCFVLTGLFGDNLHIAWRSTPVPSTICLLAFVPAALKWFSASLKSLQMTDALSKLLLFGRALGSVRPRMLPRAVGRPVEM